MMAEELFNYDAMVEDALRSVVRRAIGEAEKHGLPGNHHFYITFRTAAPGVSVPSYLALKYPDEMTIVLQYQFWNLEVLPERFEVTLSFSDVHERLIVPFAAITSFADPSVKFGLQFQSATEQTASEPAGGEEIVSSENAIALPTEESGPDSGGATENAGDDAGSGQIVSLDQFRKKK